jgi:hypothetical protein
LITGFTSAASPRVDISSNCKVGQETWSVYPSVDMLRFGMTIPATVPQRSEIPEGLMNHPVFHVLAMWSYGVMLDLAYFVLYFRKLKLDFEPYKLAYNCS